MFICKRIKLQDITLLYMDCNDIALYEMIYSIPDPTLDSSLPLLRGSGLVASLGTPRTSDATYLQRDIFVELFELPGISGKVQFVTGHHGKSTGFIIVNLFVELDVFHDNVLGCQTVRGNIV